MSTQVHRLPIPRLAVLVAVLFTLATVQAVLPAPALGATTLAASCDGVALRTRAITSATVKVRLHAATKVVAIAKVSGARWSTRCAGRSAAGSTWYRITSINGKSVRALYGVTYLYAATSLFKTLVTPVTLATACSGVSLRTTTTTSATAKVKLAAGAKVVASTSVTGGSWSASCPGYTAGTAWYRITSVNGTSVSALYGVAYVYGAAGLFKAPTTAPLPTPAPTPAPTPTPSPSPTPDPGATPTPVPTPTPTPSPTYIEGIDVSNWQGTINWTAVAASGKAFAFLKASESIDFTDVTYATNRAQAKAAGLVVGAYHFAQPNATPGDAIAEADWFVSRATIASGDLRPVLDLEAGGKSTTGGLAAADLQAWVQAFTDRVYQRTGVRPLIYVSPNFWTKYLGDTTSVALGGYNTLWIAHWTTAAAPLVPASNWGGNGWTFWQYTSSGTVPGITGSVDLDRFRLTDFTPYLVP